MFSHLPPYAGDPILSLMEVFQRDERANKVNLSIGIYTDGRGVVPVLPSVRAAATEIAQSTTPYVYLPMEGLGNYRQAVAQLLFGADLPAPEHLAVVQTLGGSGALKVGADLIARFFPQPTVWIPDPTWDNHIGIFEGAGFKVERYPYYDAATRGLDFDAMLAKIGSLPKGAVVLLHPCCHNPTGVDPTREQWQQIVSVIEQRGLLPFFDLAYQGFAESLDEDIWPVRECVRRGIAFFLSNSFSKIFSLYSERVGALSVFCPNRGEAANVLGQLKLTVRRNYSSPPMHGALLVARVLSDPALAAQWRAEVEEMRLRVRDMRTKLAAQLKTAVPDQDFSFLLRQHGMFGYTGLTAAQVDRLRNEFGVYAIATGRICVAGLNDGNVARVAETMAEVLRG
ncbi:aspartate/tyrosine/aromatic aminotransferase [Herbaspirillum sp. LeCh32-8]|uniref:amino acid aminotransferase n=1 Tax=Herbaspirillum sp. LeCh32-8 TaxID=2821356 RepID=UPI001AEA11A1|nr:amino acid aminotransferase [Herbaspirillum sp. LeCh32-8]MBP0599783.1 aspartate/tyrosine/aromatic aminotransferase [Herbaspirillum sp. LeCh32-8]